MADLVDFATHIQSLIDSSKPKIDEDGGLLLITGANALIEFLQQPTVTS